MKADDFGRFHAEVKRLKSACFPLKDSIRNTDISRWLTECEAAGLVRCYDVTEGRFLCIHKFDQRLRLKRERFPRPPDDGHMTVISQPTDSHMSKPFVSVSTSDSVSQGGDRGPGEGDVRAQLRREMSECFKRPVSESWTYEEECLLLEVCKSPTAIEEWYTLRSYRTKAKERHHRFSIRTLLTNWKQDLDAARTYVAESRADHKERQETIISKTL